MALLVVAVEQCGGCAVVVNSGYFPSQVIGIADAGVTASCTKWADHFGGVSHKEYAFGIHAFNQLAAVAVRAYPHNVAFSLRAKLFGQALTQHVFTADIGWVVVWAHLVVNPPHVIRHEVLPHGAVVVERRFNPSVALSGWLHFKTHVCYAPPVVALDARYWHIAPLVKRCACASAIHHIGGIELVVAFRGVYLQVDAVPVAGAGTDPRLPAHIDHAQLGYTLHQIAFYIKLLDIDERWLAGQFEVCPVAQVEVVHLVVACERAPYMPLNAFGLDALKDTQFIEHLKRLLCVANPPR